MAISVTEILGTDSLSGSRLVINDNFNILTSEINAMENYFSPSAGTITNLNNLQTNALSVGGNQPRLDINASTFDIMADVAIQGGNLNLNGGGLIRNSVDPQTLNEVFSAPTLTVEVGTSTAVPPYTVERVSNDGAAAVTVQLNDGSIGQEIFFVYSGASTGEVKIVGASNPLILGSTNNTVSLDGQGETVHLVCVDNGTGNGDWYIVGGNGYVIS
tara:strand:- start:800 stop:1447 length:648 start_codon:yes stop_codon:yes gene_type:complete